MNRAYIAGKMRGEPEENIPLFEKAAELLRGAGWFIISPVELNRKAGILPGTPLTPTLLRRIAKMDLDSVMSLEGEHGDALILLTPWETSVGGTAEVGAARFVKLPVYRLFIHEDGKGWHLEAQDVSL